ncbi:porin family protein [Bacteroides fluxus]|uniref:Outer membrane protein beta-barrel domain-containing protein n=1 Tax=Bacteroides fluxus YIT 12057 TaxID=763034 RepID=F3PUC8_9BACE|nr:porin family protein [Bacteroides fluxus]EGF56225.1 hypothetical protein HMPREF9446_02351 [Bacteroides fluxus YIT 12057]MDY3788538.1 porin family protein [Bacteroides fluxus]
MRKIIIIICFAMAALASSAQSPISFHAKAGIGTSNFWGKHSSSETRIAYKAGIGAEYALSRTWVVQSALEFVSIGGKDEIKYGKADMNELYLQIPVMMAARLTLNKNYHISLSAGPYVAIGLGGKTSGERHDYTGSHHSNDYRFKLDTFGSMLDNNMGNQRFDTGIAMGLTFEYHRFVIGAETQVGFVTVNKQLNLMMNPDGYSEYLPRNFAAFFTVGYRF